MGGWLGLGRRGGRRRLDWGGCDGGCVTGSGAVVEGGAPPLVDPALPFTPLPARWQGAPVSASSQEGCQAAALVRYSPSPRAPPPLSWQRGQGQDARGVHPPQKPPPPRVPPATTGRQANGKERHASVRRRTARRCTSPPSLPPSAPPLLSWRRWHGRGVAASGHPAHPPVPPPPRLAAPPRVRIPVAAGRDGLAGGTHGRCELPKGAQRAVAASAETDRGAAATGAAAAAAAAAGRPSACPLSISEERAPPTGTVAASRSAAQGERPRPSCRRGCAPARLSPSPSPPPPSSSSPPPFPPPPPTCLPSPLPNGVVPPTTPPAPPCKVPSVGVSPRAPLASPATTVTGSPLSASGKGAWLSAHSILCRTLVRRHYHSPTLALAGRGHARIVLGHTG